MAEPPQTTHPSEVRRLEAENVELREKLTEETKQTERCARERDLMETSLLEAEERAKAAESRDPDDARDYWLENQELRERLLTDDDRTRLAGIATAIDILVRAGDVHPDYGARDVRFLRGLATAHAKEEQ